MKRHQMQNCKQTDIVGNIINKVSQRANMDVKPLPIPKKLDDPKPTPDTDTEESDSEEESDMEIEFMPNNPEDLKREFKRLYKKLEKLEDIYDKLVYMLDELKRMKCLTKEECDAMNKCLQEKVGI